jgi:hypothetical protein
MKLFTVTESEKEILDIIGKTGATPANDVRKIYFALNRSYDKTIKAIDLMKEENINEKEAINRLLYGKEKYEFGA